MAPILGRADLIVGVTQAQTYSLLAGIFSLPLAVPLSAEKHLPVASIHSTGWKKTLGPAEGSAVIPGLFLGLKLFPKQWPDGSVLFLHLETEAKG